MKIFDGVSLRFVKKNLTYLILTALFAAVYLVSYNRKFGVSFMAAFVFVVIVSYVTAKTCAQNITVFVSVSKEAVTKGENVKLRVNIENGSVFPVPFLSVGLYGGWNLKADSQNNIELAVSQGEASIVEKTYTAEIWGEARLGIISLTFRDFFGLFEAVYEDGQNLFSKSISVSPALNEPGKNDLLAYIANEAVNDEGEEESAGEMNLFAQPGYTHRPYVAGDPLKRINWKLLAKMNKYMVRESEYLKSRDMSILLDYKGLRGDITEISQRRAALLEERIIEAVLANLISIVNQHMACKVFFFYQDDWQDADISNEDGVVKLQRMFSSYKFSGTNRAISRIPSFLSECGGIVTVFTCCPDDELYNSVLEAKISGCDIAVVRPEETNSYIENSWAVTASYDFYAV
ncbi:MAG: DUF58 domain-containing protein [Clostridiales bacterium]|jgi:hypothetical protein|nr:DUF58 domain-containing protein [Clostridiales bacterium]